MVSLSLQRTFSFNSFPEYVHVYHSYDCFFKIFIHFKIRVAFDWPLLFVSFLVNWSAFPGVLYVEWVWIISWTFRFFFFKWDCESCYSPLENVDFFCFFVLAGSQLIYILPLHWVGCQFCLLSLCSAALGPLCASPTLGFWGDLGGGFDHSLLVLKASAGFLCVCVMQVRVRAGLRLMLVWTQC